MKLIEALNKNKTLYHGTALPYLNLILFKGLKPAPYDEYCYLTENKNAAKKYAKAWSAAIIEDDVEKRIPEEKKYKGVIVKFEIPIKLLEIDDWNVDGEPGQFKYKGILPTKYLKSYEQILFNDLKNSLELIRNYSFWIGIVRR